MKRIVTFVVAAFGALGVSGGCAGDRSIDVAHEPLVSSGQFFSQNDPAWAGDHLGTCGGSTIGSAGCALAATAMAASAHGLTVDPGALDQFLTANHGFANGCEIIWEKAADFDGPGGFTYLGAGDFDSLAGLKQDLDAGHSVVVQSKRFGHPDHWVIVTGYTESGTSWHHFTYWDPWDTTAQTHTMSDGNVMIGAPTRVFE